MVNDTQVWLVTGSSRGLGRAIARAALRAGHRVAATARRPEQLADLAAEFGAAVLPLQLDVTDAAQARAAVNEAAAVFGRIDVLVNNAGYGAFGALEELSEAELKAQIDTNLHGVLNVTRAVLPVMRQQRSGHIFQVSSIGGRVAMPGLGAYHLTKFAVEGMSESLAQEVAPLGIRVTIVEPGGFRTDWAGPSMTHATPIGDYDASVRAFRQMITEGFVALGDPDKAGRVLVEMAGRDDAPLRLALGSEAVLMLRAADERHLAELERWADVSRSTDADDVTPEHLAALGAQIAAATQAETVGSA